MASDITIIRPISHAPSPFIHVADISGVASDGQLVDLWLSECRSRHTLKLYGSIAMRYLATLPHGLRGSTVADVSRFEASIAHMKPNSKHTLMNVVRSLYSFARRTGYLPLSPAHARKNRKPPHSLHKRCLDVDEVWAIIDHARCERDALFMRFLYGTAVRVSEALSATWSDVQMVKSLQKINVLGKGGTWRMISVPAWVGLLRPDPAHSDDHIFTAAKVGDPHPHQKMSYELARRIVYEAALRASIGKPATPHWFRHSSITHMQDAGMRPKDVQKQAGHESLNTTSMYSHGRDDIIPGDVLERKK